jgi:glucose/arabinose dehydrogenase
MARRWFYLLVFGLFVVSCSQSPVQATVIGTSPILTVTASYTSEPVLPSATPIPAQSATISSPIPITPTITTPVLFPDGAAYQWKLVAGGLEKPNTIANAGDGSGRLFIIEQAGRVRIIKDGQLRVNPFLDIRGRVGSDSSERGLLGIAFHPQYKENGLFYVNYTDKGGNTVIARYKVSTDPEQADPASEKVLLHINQPYANHNGGNLVFGPDGYLYAGMGDGGSAGDPQGYAQSLDSLLGKLLRIDVEHGDPYAIPAENPLAKGGGRPEIVAYGLRNPWRFSFDRQTGDLYIGDVGQNLYEEIDFLPAGTRALTNFGWNFREGLHAYSNQVYSGKIPLTDPILEYDHTQGCSITGGVVYRGQTLAEFNGIYLFGDYCQGRVWGLARQDGRWVSSQLFKTSFSITAMGEDEKGEVYLADYKGNVLRLERK